MHDRGAALAANLRSAQVQRSVPAANTGFMIKPGTIWTIGHSSLTLERFMHDLQRQGVEMVVDVRAYPASRHVPWTERRLLSEALAGQAIAYAHLPELGGRRRPVGASVNHAWRNASFRGYADHMATAEFREGLAALKEVAHAHRAAIMCAERLWWSCHRALISDRLKADGWTVWHIAGADVSEHPYTTAAQVIDGDLSYRDPVLFSEGSGTGT
jgi:uncharacterized protein (DUF488 family)